jgi:hypothetical protein
MGLVRGGELGRNYTTRGRIAGERTASVQAQGYVGRHHQRSETSFVLPEAGRKTPIEKSFGPKACSKKVSQRERTKRSLVEPMFESDTGCCGRSVMLDSGTATYQANESRNQGRPEFVFVQIDEIVRSRGPIGQTDDKIRIFSVLTRAGIGPNTPVRRKAQLSF